MKLRTSTLAAILVAVSLSATTVQARPLGFHGGFGHYGGYGQGLGLGVSGSGLRQERLSQAHWRPHTILWIWLWLWLRVRVRWL